MTVNRTTLLDLPLPVTGTESGTWGDTTNNGLTQYLDIAIAGTLVLSTDADVTLTSTEGDSSATNIGATTAQYAILRWTATGSTTRNITALAQSKTYVVINATGGTQSIVLRGAGPTTGVTIISGEKALCVWNGSDFVKVSSSAAAGGSNTQVQYNSSGVLAGSANFTFNGTTVTMANDASVNGLTVGRGAGAVATNTAVGASALAVNTTGVQNTSVGNQSLANITSGSYNTAVGYQTSNTNQTGAETTSIGWRALYLNTGNHNTGIGSGSFYNNSTGVDNTGVGKYSGFFNTTGNYNTGVGSGALFANTTASNNTAVGYQAAYTNTTGTGLVAVGIQAGYSHTNGLYSTFVGGLAGYTQSTASGSVFVGYRAGYNNNNNWNTGVGAGYPGIYLAALESNTTGQRNVALGVNASGSNTTGSDNVAIGVQASAANTTGSYNTAIGNNALQANTTASNNTAVGYQAGYTQTIGNGQNTYLGYRAGYLVTGERIVAIGSNAGYGAALGNASTVVGESAGYNSTGANNTFFGNAAGYGTASTGNGNTAIGALSGYALTSGQANTFVGSAESGSTESSGRRTTSGSYNVAVGSAALSNNTTGASNTAVGYQAGYSNTAADNTFVGWRAGYSNTTGTPNTYIGVQAGYNTTGSINTFVGQSSGYFVTTGSKNTILGAYTGNQGGLDIRTASNNVVLSDGDGNVREYINSSGNVYWGMGQATYNNGVAMESDATFVYFQTYSSKPLKINNLGNSVYIQNAYDTTTATAANMVVGTNGLLQRSTSSLKYKKNIQDASYGLADVLKLRAVTYQAKDSVTKNDKGEDVVNAASAQVLGGLIAEEVHEVGLTQFVQYAEDGSPDALAYGNMISLCIKAIQELKSELDTVKAELATLKGA